MGWISSWISLSTPRVEKGYAKACEVFHVSGNERQVIFPVRSPQSDHRQLIELLPFVSLRLLLVPIAPQLVR